MRKRIGQATASAGFVALAVLALSRTTRARRAARVGRSMVERRVHGIPGRLRGLHYKLRRRHPDEHVSDLVLADRVRSSIGRVEKELDLPHIHVMVNDHVAMLHGEVATRHDAERLVKEIEHVTGVKGVKSFLHVGLLPSDTKPSTGHAQPPPPSAAFKQLTDTAVRVGAPTAPTTVLRAVLSTFCEQIPIDEREHVLGHLPGDVRRLAERPLRQGVVIERIRHANDLFDAVASADHAIGASAAQAVTLAVLADLARLVPEERRDIEATLPEELRRLWGDAQELATSKPPISVGQIELLEQS